MSTFRKKIKHNLIDSTISVGILLSIVLTVFLILHFSPFGNHSLAIVDADIQYLDLFGYLKDILDGNNSISYSFSNILGSNSIGVFAYYLSSPVNIILPFFNKNDLVLFYDISVIIKLAISTVTFTLFINGRFKNSVSKPFNWIFAVSYALMTYNIVQSANIMWLDGIYMLPLMLLGIYKITSGKSPLFFSIATALSLLFNWYSGGINCLFAIIWLVLELVLKDSSKASSIIKAILNFLIGLLFAALISATLLLPTVYCLSLGKGESFDWELLNATFTGNLLTVIPEYSIGAVSSKEAFSVYCGSFVLVGLIVFFTFGKSIKKKIIGSVFLFISVLILYWQPFILSFSLFKKADSYFSRYSYLSTFLILFFAASAFIFVYKKRKEHNFHIVPFFITGAVFTAIYLILGHKKIVAANVPFKYNLLTVSFFLSLLIITSLLLKFRSKKRLYVILSSAITVICIAELSINTALLLKNNFSKTDNNAINEYIDNTYAQLDALQKENEMPPYRINRTVVRGRSLSNQQAHYDESFFFNYYGIGSYTSCTDNAQINLLDRLGYKQDGNCINIINDSVLSADSLLGAKYITVKEPFDFLNPIDYKNAYSYLYKNIYAFPIAFKIKKDAAINFESSSIDTFDYQNKLFTALTGLDKNIFNKLEFSEEKSTEKNNYLIKQISEKNPVYGYFIYNKIANGVVSTGNTIICDHAKWIAPSLFRIPDFNNENKNLQIDLKADDLSAFTHANFCELDTEVLSEMAEIADNNSANDMIMENSFFSCNVEADSDEKLFTSIPYTKGWNITVNDIPVEPELLYDCLMIIPLQEGNNKVTMSYTLPYLKEGIILSLAGIGGLIVYSAIYYKFKLKTEDY